MSSAIIDKQVVEAELSVTNALANAEIKTALAVYLYDDARLNEGLSLINKAKRLQAKQAAEYSEQYTATAALNKAWETADAAYSKYLKLTRIVLKDKPTLLQLERRKKSFNGRLAQAMRFYTNVLANAEVMAGLAKFGVTQADLEAGQALIQAVLQSKSVQETEMGEAQRATEARDEALDAMADWMSDFKQVAEIALTDDRQMLEVLGFGPV